VTDLAPITFERDLRCDAARFADWPVLRDRFVAEADRSWRRR
jgi:hypothetical protein